MIIKNKLSVSMDELIIITELDGVNYVPAINNGKSFDYHNTGRFYAMDSCAFGILNRDGFRTFEGYKSHLFFDLYIELVKDFDRGSTKTYFDLTHHFVDDYKRLVTEYNDLMASDLSYKKKESSEICKKYRNFLADHPMISRIDIRFAHLMVEETCAPSQAPVKTRLYAYEPTPSIDYETYKQFLESYFVRKKAEIEIMKEYTIAELEEDYSVIKKTLEDLLLKHPKVGLVFVETFMPKRMKEVMADPLFELTMDTYGPLKKNTIYWFN